MAVGTCFRDLQKAQNKLEQQLQTEIMNREAADVKFQEQIAGIDRKFEHVTQTLAEIKLQLLNLAPTSRCGNNSVLGVFSQTSGGQFGASQNHAHSSLPRIGFSRFDGSNFRAWFLQCNSYFKLMPTTDSQRIHLATMHFDGKSLSWIQTLNMAEVEITWKQFLEVVSARFENLKVSNILVGFNELKQNGSYEDYVSQVELADKSVEGNNVKNVEHESIEFELKKLVPSLNLQNKIILNSGIKELLLGLPGWRTPAKMDGIGGSFLGNYLKSDTNWWEAPMRKDGIGVLFLDSDLRCEISCRFYLDPLQLYVSYSLNCARKFGLFVKYRSKVEVEKNVGSKCCKFLKRDALLLEGCGNSNKPGGNIVMGLSGKGGPKFVYCTTQGDEANVDFTQLGSKPFYIFDIAETESQGSLQAISLSTGGVMTMLTTRIEPLFALNQCTVTSTDVSFSPILVEWLISDYVRAMLEDLNLISLNYFTYKEREKMEFSDADGNLKIALPSVLDSHFITRKNKKISVFVPWLILNSAFSKWEDEKYICSTFLTFDPWGQGSCSGGGIVMDGGGLKEHGGEGRKKCDDRKPGLEAMEFDSWERRNRTWAGQVC